jgi:hypothetical protein
MWTCRRGRRPLRRPRPLLVILSQLQQAGGPGRHSLPYCHIPAVAQRLDAPAALAPNQRRDLLGYLAQIADPWHRRGRRPTLAPYHRRRPCLLHLHPAHPPLITNQTSPHPAETRPRPLPPGPSRRVVVTIRGSVADQARAAVLFLQTTANPAPPWPATSTTPSGSASSVTGPSSTRALFPPCAHAMKAGAEIKQEAK